MTMTRKMPTMSPETGMTSQKAAVPADRRVNMMSSVA
jgi:hypothetical protein